jgi:osmotically-inducible protein OsmY
VWICCRPPSGKELEQSLPHAGHVRHEVRGQHEHGKGGRDGSDKSVDEAVDVTVKDGFVTLTGTALWQYEREEAEFSVTCNRKT